MSCQNQSSNSITNTSFGVHAIDRTLGRKFLLRTDTKLSPQQQMRCVACTIGCRNFG